MINEYEKLIDIRNIFSAWRKFSSGKADKKDVLEFWRNLENNLFNLHNDLILNNYRHGNYEKFAVCDPKERIIHKARIGDRIIHQLIFDYLRPIFEKRFIFDSYSSRMGKGTHKAVKRLRLFCKIVSKNNARQCWILKCDIRKFFDSIDHKILFSLIEKKVADKKIKGLIFGIIKSFEAAPGKGLPLGNLTSQLFANIYLHQFDYFIKNILRFNHYVRFNDDFAFAHHDREFLESKIKLIKEFLSENLTLLLPDDKISFRKLDWGIDFLGYIILPEGVLMRTKTRKRMVKKIRSKMADYRNGRISFNKAAQTINSYFGTLKHCSSFKLRQKIFDFTINMLD